MQEAGTESAPMVRDARSAYVRSGTHSRLILFSAGLILFAGIVFFFRGQLRALCSYGLADITFLVRTDTGPLLTAENNVLREQALMLREKLRQCSSLNEENERLRKMLSIEKKYPLTLVAASVLWKDPTDWKRIVVIDKGKRDNLMKDMLVINGDGFLVGKIAEVTNNFSYVMLLTDPSFKIIATVDNKPVEGLYRGNLVGGGTFSYIAEDAPIAEKDRLHISENSMYPSGFLIGSVQRIRKGKDAFSLTIEVGTAADISGSTYVFVVKKAPEYMNSSQ